MGVAAGEWLQRYWAESGRWHESGGRDVLCIGGQPGAEPDEWQLQWAGQRLGNGQRQLHPEQRQRTGDPIAEHIELWQRSALYECAGGWRDEVLPVQRAGGGGEH